MKSIEPLVVSIGIIFVNVFCCPPESDIDPCFCVNESKRDISITCVGEDLNDDNIDVIIDSLNNYLLSKPLTVVQLFRLQKTSLTTLKEDVFGLIPFINLEIYDNSLLDLSNVTINTFLASIYTLRSFYGSKNGLFESDGSSLVSVFNSFVELKYLTIKDNLLEKISRNTFNNKDQNNLKFIDLSSNRISSVGDFAFSQLSSLIYLNLSNNTLVKLSPNCFNLRQWSSAPLQLLLNSNQLTSDQLTEDLFNQIKRPLILFLQNNQMESLPENVFKSIVENDQNYLLDVKDNPFVCDCERHQWLFHLAKHLRMKIQNLFCGEQTVWDYENLVIKNCF